MNIGVKCIQCLMILMIVACQTEINKSETVVRHGVVYQKGHKKPFTGFVVGRGREDYRAQMCRYKKQYKDGLLHGTSTYCIPTEIWRAKSLIRTGKSMEPSIDTITTGR